MKISFGLIQFFWNQYIKKQYALHCSILHLQPILPYHILIQISKELTIIIEQLVEQTYHTYQARLLYPISSYVVPSNVSDIFKYILKKSHLKKLSFIIPCYSNNSQLVIHSSDLLLHLDQITNLYIMEKVLLNHSASNID